MNLFNFTVPSDFNFWGSVYFLVELLAIAFAIRAILMARTSQGAIAWAISLILLPWVSIPLYVVFGTHRLQTHLMRRRKGEEYIGKDTAQLDWLKDFECVDDDLKFYRVLEKLSLLPFFRGNKVKLLINGQDTFNAIFSAIDSAKDYILILFFIVDDDGLGNQLKSHLIQARKRGVRIYFLYDAIGSRELDQAYVDELASHGIEIDSFKIGKGPAYPWQINFRNHRKIVVVDGEVGYLGGHNVGDEYLGLDPALTPWRDTHLEIYGPAVLALQIPFLEDWYWSTEKIPEVSWKSHSFQENKKVLILPSGPADSMESCGLFFTHIINQAQTELWIASPYFVPDGKIQSALKLAALKGVDVRILIPERPDHVMVYWARYDYIYPLQLAGVKFYMYTNGFLHQKPLQVDGEMAAVGTANLDNRSFRLNFEATAVIVDDEFAQKVREMFINDFDSAQVYPIIDPDQWTTWEKILIKSSRLFSPIL